MINSALVELDSPQKSRHKGNYRRSLETPVEGELFGKLENYTGSSCVHCFHIWSMEEKEAIRCAQERR